LLRIREKHVEEANTTAQKFWLRRVNAGHVNAPGISLRTDFKWLVGRLNQSPTDTQPGHPHQLYLLACLPTLHIIALHFSSFRCSTFRSSPFTEHYSPLQYITINCIPYHKIPYDIATAVTWSHTSTVRHPLDAGYSALIHSRHSPMLTEQHRPGGYEALHQLLRKDPSRSTIEEKRRLLGCLRLLHQCIKRKRRVNLPQSQSTKWPIPPNQTQAAKST
jgi:hypothetical protein